MVASSGVAGCALVSGLSDLDVATQAVVDASTDSGSDGGTDGPTALDGARDADAGGFDVVPLPDAGKDADAAPGCTVLGSDPTAVTTTCTTGSPFFSAGALPTGTYWLTQVREFPATCNGYQAVSATGLLLVAAQGSLFMLEERLTIGGVTTSRHYTATMNGTTMTVALTCGPAIPSNTWQLNLSQGSNGKTTFVVYKTSPPVDQRFFWTQQ